MEFQAASGLQQPLSFLLHSQQAVWLLAPGATNTIFTFFIDHYRVVPDGYHPPIHIGFEFSFINPSRLWAPKYLSQL
jgi:hypothetical protein